MTKITPHNFKRSLFEYGNKAFFCKGFLIPKKSALNQNFTLEMH